MVKAEGPPGTEAAGIDGKGVDSNSGWVVEGEGAALETDGSRLEVYRASAFGWLGRCDCTFDE